MKIRTYSELITFKTFEERFNYLALYGKVGYSTFGADRYLNQNFYRSREWRQARNIVIIRDGGCDLSMDGHDIYDKIYVHHMNPITMEDLDYNFESLIDPELLICTSFNTHQAISFGNRNNLLFLPKERRRGDTTLW